MNADSVLFRCSSLGYLMIEPREKAAKERGDLSETTKTHLVDKYVSVKYNRETDITNKYIEKGLAVEEDSITLYSRLKKKFYKKNSAQITNDFISGHPDLFEGDTIYTATHIPEIKSSWDIFTYFRAKTKPIDKHYYWQCQGYMALTGAKTSSLAYCLVNTPDTILFDEKKRLQYKMGVISDSDPDYIEACAAIEKNMTFDDIPMNERMFEIHINRNDSDIEKLYERIKQCREYMNRHLFITQEIVA